MHPNYQAGQTIGQAGGSETVTLTNDQVANHTHQLIANGNSTSAKTADPSNGLLTISDNVVYNTPTNLTDMSPIALSATGGSKGHKNIQPSLGLNFIISLRGVYPQRN